MQEPVISSVFPPNLSEEFLKKEYPSNIKVKSLLFIHRHGERTPTQHFIRSFISPNWNLCHLKSTFHANLTQFLQETSHRSHESLSPELHTQYHPAEERPINTNDSHYPGMGEVLTANSLQSLPSHFLSQENLKSVGSVERLIEEPGQIRDKILGKHFTKAPEFSGKCFFGQLTDKGRESLFSIGKGLRELYVEKLKFLPEKWTSELDEGQFYCRTTDYPRTLESIQHFLGGLYPQNKREGNKLIKVYTRSPLSGNERENLFGDNGCRQWRKQLNSFKQRYKEEQFDHIERMKHKNRHFLADHDKPSLHALYDTFIALYAHGFPLPKGVSERDVIDLEKHANNLWFEVYQKNDKAVRLGIGRLVGEISEILNHKKKELESNFEDGLKLAVFSGHDSTIAPLLGAFQIGDGRWPPFASNIAIELVEDVKQHEFYVRARYNGKTKNLPACQNSGDHHPDDTSLCTFSAFMTRIQEVIPKDYDAECAEDS